MKELAVVRRSLYELRWQIIWYGLGLGLYGAFIVWLYPSFEDTLRNVDYPQEYLDFFGASGGSLTEPTTFLTTEYWSFAPIVFVIYSIVASTGMVAGEEGRGSLETVLAQPISRVRYMLEKVAAFVVGAVAITAVIGLLWLTSVPFVDFHGDLTLGEVWTGTVAMLPLVFFFGGLGFLVGAIAPSRGLAAGILTVLAIAAYLITSFARAISAIEWMQYLSPYYYADTTTVLADGIVWWHALLLLGGAVLTVLLALSAFRGREIGAGIWQPAAILAGR